MQLVADRNRTADRRARLEAYLAQSVLVGGDFICRHQETCVGSACRSAGVDFYEAQLSYLGPVYDLFASGTPLRVLIIPMEGGGPARRVSLDERALQVRGRIGERFQQRNPHMRGVTLALQLAFGLDVERPADEWLETGRGRVHVFDAYAMANLLLCSAVADMTTSRATPTMRANCIEHLVATIEILEPTLIISQGVTVEPALRAAFEIGERIDNRVWRASCAGAAFVWVALRHPSRGNWQSSASSYFREVVAPAIMRAREAVLGTAAGAAALDLTDRRPSASRSGDRASQASEIAPGPVRISTHRSSGTSASMVDMRQHPELSVPERRRFGKSAEMRTEALRRYRRGDTLNSIATWLGLNHNQVRYLLMQERIDDGEVPRVSPTPEAIRAALVAGGEFGSTAWVACRAGVVENDVRRV